jgi:hypothetical protein
MIHEKTLSKKSRDIVPLRENSVQSKFVNVLAKDKFLFLRSFQSVIMLSLKLKVRE